MTNVEYERPIVIDYGSIADHTFGDALNAPSPPSPPGVRPLSPAITF
jgi:hypothetical protein